MNVFYPPMQRMTMGQSLVDTTPTTNLPQWVQDIWYGPQQPQRYPPPLFTVGVSFDVLDLIKLGGAIAAGIYIANKMS